MKLVLTLLEANRRIAASLKREGIPMDNDPYFAWKCEDGETTLEVTVHSPDEELNK